jgi:hypothetical protein
VEQQALRDAQVRRRTSEEEAQALKGPTEFRQMRKASVSGSAQSPCAKRSVSIRVATSLLSKRATHSTSRGSSWTLAQASARLGMRKA